MTLKAKKQKKCADNHFRNILRFFAALPNFLFSKSEAMRGNYL